MREKHKERKKEVRLELDDILELSNYGRIEKGNVIIIKGSD